MGGVKNRINIRNQLIKRNKISSSQRIERKKMSGNKDRKCSLWMVKN